MVIASPLLPSGQLQHEFRRLRYKTVLAALDFVDGSLFDSPRPFPSVEQGTHLLK